MVFVSFTSDTYINPAETGFYYLESRYYDPVVGRFINADKLGVLTIAFDDVIDNNLYAYCNNNPILYKDTTGEIPVFAVKVAVGAAVNLASEWVISGASGEDFTLKDAIYAVVEGAIVAGITSYVKKPIVALVEGAAGFLRSKKIEGNDIYEALGDGLVAGFGSYYSVIEKFERKFIPDHKLVTKDIKKSYEVVKGLFEYSGTIAKHGFVGIANNKKDTKVEKKTKQSPVKFHTRTWFKEREM